MKYTQNEKIKQVTENTLVIGIDVGSEVNFARAFDWRGMEETKKAFRFSNDTEGFNTLREWTEALQQKTAKTEVLMGCEPTGHYWFPLARYLKGQELKLVVVNPYHVKQLKEPGHGPANHTV